MRTGTIRYAAVAAAITITAGGCSGGGSSTPSSPSGGGGGGGPTTPPAATIIITANGVNPSAVTVPVGSRVAFVNNGSRAVAMSSDPHPTHTDCPNIDATGLLQPGQTGTTGPLTVARRCGFHDHNDDTNNAMKGSITVQ
jgi:plastocyanin